MQVSIYIVSVVSQLQPPSYWDGTVFHRLSSLARACVSATKNNNRKITASVFTSKSAEEVEKGIKGDEKENK